MYKTNVLQSNLNRYIWMGLFDCVKNFAIFIFFWRFQYTKYPKHQKKSWTEQPPSNHTYCVIHDGSERQPINEKEITFWPTDTIHFFGWTFVGSVCLKSGFLSFFLLDFWKKNSLLPALFSSTTSVTNSNETNRINTQIKSI